MLIKLRYALLGTLLLTRCTVHVPDGVFACSVDWDCADGQRCGDDRRCARSAGHAPASPDTAQKDAAVSAAQGGSSSVAAVGGSSAPSAAGSGGSTGLGGAGVGGVAGSTGVTAGTGAVDAGSADPSASVGTIGEACAGMGRLGCQGHASKQRLSCDGSRWRDNGTCSDTEHCETLTGLATGLCLQVVAECKGASPGDRVCEVNDLRTCDQDLLASKFVETCTFPTPNCDHDRCKCLDLCGGVCSDLAADSNNCGVCGHNCLGGKCIDHYCQPVTLASGQSFASNRNNGAPSIAIDSSAVYWTSDTGVMTVPIAGGTTRMLAALTALPGGIAVDASNVYWGERTYGPPSSGAVRKLALAGGTPVTLTSDASHWPYRLSVDASSVYFTNALPSSAVVKIPIAGGAATAIAMGRPGPYDIAIDSSYVYWLERNDTIGAIVKAPLNGGSPVTVISMPDTIGSLALDAGSLFWTGSNHDLFTLPVSGGSALRLGDGNGLLSVDANFVYMATCIIEKVPRAGGAVVKLFGDVCDHDTVAITADAVSLYWIGGNAVMRLAK
jgi:hypothetical protein